MPTTIFPSATPGTDIPSARGEMLRLINDFDWASTVLGPMAVWPQALTVTTRLMLASEVAMVMLMGEKGVLIYNDAYAQFAAARHPGILGQEVAKAWPEIADFNEAILKRVLAGENVSLKDQFMSLNRSGAFEDLWLDLDYSPVLDESGRPVGEFVIVRETTKRVLAERALERTEESLSFALAASGMVGIWDWNVVDDVVTSDVRFAEMYGVDPAKAAVGAPIGDFVEGIHPDDRARVTEEINGALATKSEFRSEYRLRNAKGEIRWVLALGRAIAIEDGAASVRLPGVVVDITDRKAAEAALVQSEAKFRAIADTMPQMVWSTLPDGFHDYYNARWYEYTGTPPGTTDGDGWSGMFHPDDQDRAWATWRRSLETGEIYEIEYRLRHHSGDYRWVLGRALPIYDEDGRVVRWFGTCTDIHESRLAAEEREVIAQELSHRIKNIFSVLNGIVGLSARSYPEARDFAEQLRTRIIALGKAHDYVRPHSQESRPLAIPPSLSNLLSTLLSPYVNEDAGRFSFEGDDAPIDEASATPLALLFHELGTNAAKYGALAIPSGRIVVKAARQGDRYVLDWIEDGDQPIAKPSREGFGTRLVDLSVAGQLGGKVSRSWGPNGLSVTVDIPATALTREGRRPR